MVLSKTDFPWLSQVLYPPLSEDDRTLWIFSWVICKMRIMVLTLKVIISVGNDTCLKMSHMKPLELVTTILKYLSKATWPIFPEYAPTLGIHYIWIIKISWWQVMGTANSVSGFQSNGFRSACLAKVILSLGELALHLVKFVSGVLMWVSAAWLGLLYLKLTIEILGWVLFLLWLVSFLTTFVYAL